MRANIYLTFCFFLFMCLYPGSDVTASSDNTKVIHVNIYDLRMTPASTFTTVRSQLQWRVQCLVAGGWCWPSLRCYVMPSSEPPWLLATAEQRAAEPEPGGYLCCSPALIRPHTNSSVL